MLNNPFTTRPPEIAPLPDGIAPDGVQPANGTAPDGMAPNGTSPNGSLKRPVQPAKAAKAPRRFRRVKTRTLWWLGALVLLAIIILVRRARSSGPAHAEVKTAVATRGDVSETVSASGKLQAFTTVDVKSKAGGTVLKMAVEEGTQVKQGQLICLIDREDTTAAYNQATADVRAAEAAVRQAQENARLQNASIGPQIRQAAESVNSAQAKLKQAGENLDLQKATTGPDIQQAVEAVSSAQAKLTSAQQSLVLQRRTAETTINEARSGVTSAQARLAQAQDTANAQPQLSQAAINQAQAGIDAATANVHSAEESLSLLQSATQPQERAAVQSQVDQANSDVQLAQANLTRQQTLFNKGFVARNVLDTANNQVETARASLNTAQARLDTLKEEQASQVRDAQARVESARGSLSQANAQLETARTNTVQNRLKTGDVAAARAALGQANAQLDTALANRRQIALKQADVTASQAAVRQAQAQLASTNANTGQIGVRAADVESSQAAVRQAVAALNGAQANTIQGSVRTEDVTSAQAKLDRARVTANNALLNLNQTTVVAPRDGIVLKKYVDEGTIIQSGQSGFSGGTAIVQLANVSRVYVDTQVDEADIGQIKNGQTVKINLDAYPDKPIAGHVRKVYPEAEEDQNVTYVHVQVEVAPMDVSARLRPSMNATCSFLVAEQRNTLMVPSEAVRDENGKTVVTVIKNPRQPLWEERNQEQRTVEIGVRGDEGTAIVKGLKEGETVATHITQPATASSGGMGLMGGRPRR